MTQPLFVPKMRDYVHNNNNFRAKNINYKITLSKLVNEANKKHLFDVGFLSNQFNLKVHKSTNCDLVNSNALLLDRGRHKHN